MHRPVVVMREQKEDGDVNLPALKRAIEALFTPHQLATNPALSVHMTTLGAVPLGALAQLPEISGLLQVREALQGTEPVPDRS